MNVKRIISFFQWLGVALLTAACIVASIISLKTGQPLPPSFGEELDRQVNYHFQDELNKEFTTGKGYKFGDKRHTISYGLARNAVDSSLSDKGKALVEFLNKIQRGHVYRSLNHEEGRCDKYCTRPYVLNF